MQKGHVATTLCMHCGPMILSEILKALSLAHTCDANDGEFSICITLVHMCVSLQSYLH